MGTYAAIVGKAIYTDKLDLKRVIQLAEGNA
jgi:phosphoribosylformimino-5-aminoimidazole carboxamide ribonucleotide (ProFAR) isomerase